MKEMKKMKTMKTIKKAATMLLTGSLALALYVPAFASEPTPSTETETTTVDETSTDQKAPMTVEYEVPSTYTVSIPKNIKLTASGGEVAVEASHINIKNQSALIVSLGDDTNTTYVKDGTHITGLSLKRAEDSSLPEKITSDITYTADDNYGGLPVSDNIVAAFMNQSDQASDGGSISFGALKGAQATIKAGSYEGKVCFCMQIVTAGE